MLKSLLFTYILFEKAILSKIRQIKLAQTVQNRTEFSKIGPKRPNERTASKIVQKCPKSDGSVPVFFVYSFPRGKTGFMYMNVVCILGIVHVLHRLQKSNSSYKCVVETSLILLTGLHMTVLRYSHSTLNHSL